MKNSRRNFLATSLGAIVAPTSSLLAAPLPYERTGSKILVGLAAYCFRESFVWSRGKKNVLPDSEPGMSMADFIRYCAEQGADCAELTSYFFPPDVSIDELAECRSVAHVNGVVVSGTAVGNNFSYNKGTPERDEQMTLVKDWVDNAAILGAPHIRVFAGKIPKGLTEEDANKNAIEALEEAGDYASQHGIFLGIENHDSIVTSERLLKIVQAVQNPLVGVNLDSGNFISDDIYADIAASAPFAVNVQIKTEIKVPGKDEKVPADLERVCKILKETGYAGNVVLEYEEKGKDPFEEVPKILGQLQEWCA